MRYMMLVYTKEKEGGLSPEQANSSRGSLGR